MIGSIRARWTRLLDRVFGHPPPPRDPPDGLPKLPGVDEPEGLYLIFALILGLLIAVVLEWIISANPVPPGGDPGQWIASSYPYIGRPAPSQVIFLGYPPMVFPLLGVLNIIGGGPIAAGRLFIAVGAILLGVSTYFFARSMLRRPVLALMVEGFTLVNAGFFELFFFGGYPTILGIALMQMCFGFLARWLSSYRPSYLFLAWVFLTATVLCHSLVGLLAIGAVAIVALVLLLERALPREVLFSKAGAAGAALFAIGVGGYYLATRLAKIPHPNYLQQNPLGQSKTTLNSMLYPFHLNSLPGVFGHSGRFGPAESFELTVAFAVLLMFALAFFAARRRLSVPVLVQGAFLLSILGAGIVGWTLSIVTDYRRFAYFVYIPVTLGVGFIFDYLLGIFLSRGAEEENVPGLPPLPPRPRRKGLDPITAAVAVLGSIGLVSVAVSTAIPTWQGFEVSFTGQAHSNYYLGAIAAINHQGYQGSIITNNIAADRWTRALTDRNTYAPAPPTSFVFYGSQILDDEKAEFLFNYLYGVTDGRTQANVVSLNATYFNASPAYVADIQGVPNPVLRIVPTDFNISLGGGGSSAPYNGGPAPHLRFPVPGQPIMTITYTQRAYTLTENITPHPPSPGFLINITAIATGAHNLTRLNGSIMPPLGGGIRQIGLSTTHNVWNWRSGGAAGGSTFLTSIAVTPGTLLSAASTSGIGPKGAPIQGVNFQVTSQKGLPRLTVLVNVTTPAASNLIRDVPPILTAHAILLGWTARYILLDQFAGSLPRYFETQLGALPLASFPYWSVYTLPSSYPSDPIG